MGPSLRAVAGSALLILAHLGCRTITEDLPQKADVSPSGPTVPLPVIVTPVPIPVPDTPNPTPGSTPAPNTTPTPAPTTPAPPPTGGSCSLPSGTGSGNGCARESPSFLGAVERALDTLVQQEPGLFDKSQTQGCGTCYRVNDQTRYVRRMAELMNQGGTCAMYDGEELAVKNTNAFNDQYDILTSGGFIRREGGAYRSTCYPAWF